MYDILTPTFVSLVIFYCYYKECQTTKDLRKKLQEVEQKYAKEVIVNNREKK